MKMVLGVSISGTLGIFVKNIPMDNGEIMAIRTLIGGLFLLTIYLLSNRDFPFKELKGNIVKLIVSGFLFGISGLLLFNSYDSVGVSLSSIIYSLNPVFIFIISIFFLKEDFKIKKAMGLLISVLGLLLVNGIAGLSFNPKLIFGLLAAMTYALMAIINKKIKNLDSLIITSVQLLSASFIVLIYLLYTDKLTYTLPSGRGLVYLLIISFLHTGYAMKLYYEAIQNLPAQSVALISYIESLSALISSSIVLGERLTQIEIVGAILIIGGALIGELVDIKTNKEKIKYDTGNR